MREDTITLSKSEKVVIVSSDKVVNLNVKLSSPHPPLHEAQIKVYCLFH